MHVVVLGAGVIGVTTAYYLSRHGHRVTIVDKADEIAAGASAGNGGQLSYSFTDALASPSLLLKMPRLMLGLDAAFHLRPPLDRQLIGWGLSFLRQCMPGRQVENTMAVTELALRSASLLAELRNQVPFDFSFRRAGKLVMLTDRAAMRDAEKMCALKRNLGCDIEVISFERAVEIEPAVEKLSGTYAGAVFSVNDEIGNSKEFANELGQWLAGNHDIELRLKTRVERIVVGDDGVKRIDSNQGAIETDAVVVCMGAWSGQVLRPLGIDPDIYPMRGYSLTLPLAEGSNRVSITDLGSKIVFSRIGERMRIAGFADFVGFQTGKDHARAQVLLETSRKVAPAIADYDVESTDEWAGFRPLTPDSKPIFGASSVPGLHLNTGHGSLGWTLACATSHDVAAGLQH